MGSSVIGGSKGTQTYQKIFRSSGFWTVPVGVKTARVIITGGGGANSVGATVDTIIDVSQYSGQSLPITIGSNSTTGEGGPSIFGNNLVIALGGTKVATAYISGAGLVYTGNFTWQTLLNNVTYDQQAGTILGRHAICNAGRTQVYSKNIANSPYEWGNDAGAATKSFTTFYQFRVIDNDIYAMGTQSGVSYWTRMTDYLDVANGNYSAACDVATNGSIWVFTGGNNTGSSGWGAGNGSSNYFTRPTFSGTTTNRSLSFSPVTPKVVYSSAAGLFLISGAENTSMYATSPDGLTWTNRNFPSASMTYTLDVANGRFYRTGSSPTISSSDGINWTQVLVSGNPFYFYSGISYYNNTYFATDNTSIYSSTDGINFNLNYSYSGLNATANGSYANAFFNTKWGLGINISSFATLLYSPYTIISASSSGESGGNSFWSTGNFLTTVPVYNQYTLTSGSDGSVSSSRPGSRQYGQGQCILEWVA